MRQHIAETRLSLDASYNVFFGSLFRTGTRPSYFSWQMQRYADLYTSDVVNLIHYPIFYVFSPGIVQPLPVSMSMNCHFVSHSFMYNLSFVCVCVWIA